MTILTFGPCRMDTEARKLTINGEAVHLPRAELDILRAFMTAAPGGLSAAQIVQASGTGGSPEGSRALASVYVSRLRAKLPFPIATFRSGKGASSYRLEAALDEVAA